MALAYPLLIQDFFSALRASELSFTLGQALEQSRTAAGEILTAGHGARLWQGSVRLARRHHAEVTRVEALVDLLGEPGASFFACDLSRPWPAADPGGAVLSASGAAPVVSGVSADTREIGVAGLPPGYVLSRGDLLSFLYGSAPVRYALHRVVTGGAADAGGALAAVQLVPPVRPGLAPGTALRLERPVCKAVIVPGSVSPRAAAGVASSSLGFDFIQTLR